MPETVGRLERRLVPNVREAWPRMTAQDEACRWFVGEDALDVKHPEPGEPGDEIAFRWVMNRDAMATERLAEGIGTFASDLETLRTEMPQCLEAAA